MARPRVPRSIEWRSPAGDRLKIPAFLLSPVLSPHWIAEGVEELHEYENRVNAFIGRRERQFTRVAGTQRKQKGRARRTAEQIVRERESDRRRWQNHTTERREQERAREALRDRKKPFIGIDGEGAGTDGAGRQPYLYMAASNADRSYVREVHRDGAALSVRDCLDFILSMPARATLVGYYFKYDANQILRGLIKQEKTLRRILNPYQGRYAPKPQRWGNYAITYQEGQYFRVVKLGEDRNPIKGTSRTVYEPFGFFQRSFVSAIADFEIGDAEMAQKRTGQAPYWDPVAAGLITSLTRAQLVEPVSHDPEAVIMIATDALFSTRPLPLDLGNRLGQWGMKTYPDFFLVKPGVYWSPSDREASLKSRGAPRSIVGRAAPRFEAAFTEWFDLLRNPAFVDCMLSDRLIPTVPLSLKIFNSCRRRLAHHKPWLIGKWEQFEQKQSFDWALKRDPMNIEIGEGHIKTWPQHGSIFAESYGYAPPDFDTDPNVYRTEHAEELEETLDDVTDAQPDFDEWNEYTEE